MNKKQIAEELVAVAKDLTKEHTAKEKRIDIINRILDEHQAEKIDGYLVDVVTANMLKTLYDNLKPELIKKIERVPLKKVVDIGWDAFK